MATNCGEGWLDETFFFDLLMMEGERDLERAEDIQTLHLALTIMREQGLGFADDSLREFHKLFPTSFRLLRGPGQVGPKAVIKTKKRIVARAYNALPEFVFRGELKWYETLDDLYDFVARERRVMEDLLSVPRLIVP